MIARLRSGRAPKGAYQLATLLEREKGLEIKGQSSIGHHSFKMWNFSLDDIDVLFEQAESPDLDLAFYIVSGICLSLHLIFGSLANGAVLIAFFRKPSVSCI